MSKKKNAVDIGSQISSERRLELITNYENSYPGIESSFIISKDSILKTLNKFKEVTGIRFMYGLKDELNPNSGSIFLIPCLSEFTHFSYPIPVISKEGYLDNTDSYCSILEISEQVSNFLSSKVQPFDKHTYENFITGCYFGKNSILNLINNENCQFIRYEFGLGEIGIKPVLLSLNSNLEINSEFYMDDGQTMPPPGKDDIDPLGRPGSGRTCAIKNSAEYMSIQELEKIREYRDDVLLNSDGGKPYYQMYYFISPLITAVLRSKVNEEEARLEFYKNKIAPFKQLLANNNREESFNLLKETYNSLINEFEYKTVRKEFQK